MKRLLLLMLFICGLSYGQDAYNNGVVTIGGTPYTVVQADRSYVAPLYTQRNTVNRSQNLDPSYSATATVTFQGNRLFHSSVSFSGGPAVCISNSMSGYIVESDRIVVSGTRYVGFYSLTADSIQNVINTVVEYCNQGERF